jgi:hypothetical protein
MLTPIGRRLLLALSGRSCPEAAAGPGKARTRHGGSSVRAFCRVPCRCTIRKPGPVQLRGPGRGAGGNLSRPASGRTPAFHGHVRSDHRLFPADEDLLTPVRDADGRRLPPPTGPVNAISSRVGVVRFIPPLYLEDESPRWVAVKRNRGSDYSCAALALSIQSKGYGVITADHGVFLRMGLHPGPTIPLSSAFSGHRQPGKLVTQTLLT